MTKKEIAYDYIKRRIGERRLAPGQRIIASQIADELEMSVLPIREALVALEAEKLVILTPYVGAVVAWVSHDEVLEVIELLSVLEGYATGLAAPQHARLAPKLIPINERLHAAVQGEMWSWFIELNREFHFTIYEASNNKQLLDGIRIYWSQLDILLAATSFHLTPNRARDDLADHDEMIALFSSGNASALDLELHARRHRMRTAAFIQQGQPIGTT
jgi:DNA-binding GntR family transcriptional regulator